MKLKYLRWTLPVVAMLMTGNLRELGKVGCIY